MLLSLYDTIYSGTPADLTAYGKFWIFRVGPAAQGTSGTGKAWNAPKSIHPWAWFDPDAERIIPFDWSGFLSEDGINSTYASHEFITAPELTSVSGEVLDGVVLVMIKRMPGAVFDECTDYPVTCRLTAANGEKQDQTVYLRIREN